MKTIKAPGNRAEELIAQSKKQWHDYVPTIEYFFGLLLLLISLSILVWTHEKREFSMAFATQIFAVAYTVFLLFTKRMKVFWKAQPKEYLAYRLLAWQIWIVSCFTLNRVVEVFHESTEWLSVALILSCLSNILFYWEPQLSKRFKEIVYILCATSTVLWTYFTLYTVWLYPVSFILILFLGLGFHSFIPLFLLVAHVKLLKRTWHSHNNAILFGILTPIVFTIFFVVQWNITQNKIQEAYQKSFTTTTDEVPNWVAVAQKVENNCITERILKGDLLYQNFDNRFSFMPTVGNFERLQHDPLVMTASLFSKKLAIENNEKIKILGAIQDISHETQVRLWSGDQLVTQDIITQARIYPEYRLAYTEKTLTIANTAQNSWQTQEAIYTFYLPEGSVATSLSLWINGKEEKGYLTTKSKAQAAYTTIVGVESRDPSVVHWQEGNTLSVRVFPCTSQEARRVKIGFTSPLKENNGELVYENIYFKGPEASSAKEIVKIDFSKSVESLSNPWNTTSTGTIENSGSYKPYWQLRFNTPQLSKKPFSFQGKSYVISSLDIQKEAYQPDSIFLDVNAEWSKSDFDELYETFKNGSLLVWKDGLIQLNEHNKDMLFYELKENHFSLFPLYRIPTTSTKCLLITKGTLKAPSLKDLDGSSFSASIKNINTDKEPIQIASLNETLSPYLKTLKELGVIAVNQTTIEQLKNGEIYKILPSPTQKAVNIENANMQIKEVPTTSEKTDAPNHLLRLYAYNHIMQQIGANYFKQDYLSDSLIQEAATANIVTPISSLIALETQADYERFDIKKSQNSLENATLKSSGSVPEPHEWLLIITFACIVLYLLLKRFL